MDQRRLNLDDDLFSIIERDFAGLYSGEVGLSSITGGQGAANRALENLDITGYANLRSLKFCRVKSAEQRCFRHIFATIS